VRLLLALLMAATGIAQVELGVKGGVPFTNAFETGSFFNLGFGEGAKAPTRRYAVGPWIGVRLRPWFGLQADGIYRRLGFDLVTKQATVILIYTTGTANSWEVPILAKFYLRHAGGWQPYLGTGPAFRHTGQVSASALETFGSFGPPRTISSDFEFAGRSHLGSTVSGGITRDFGKLHISPEIRYTRWREDNPKDDLFYSKSNQIDFFLGFSFR
jgi:hypothetical protein